MSHCLAGAGLFGATALTYSAGATLYATMLTYTTSKIVPAVSGSVEGADPTACVAVIDAVDWAAVMTAWMQTQEAPLPAVVFQPEADRKAEFHVSTVPGPASSFYLQVLFKRDEKIGWIRSRRQIVSAELHDPATLTRCLADLDAGRFAELVRLLNDEGRNVLN